MTFFSVLFGLFFVTFMLIVFRGAPYVPTKQRDLTRLLKEHIQKNDLIVDLGSGDGRLLLAAARKGVRSVGYELNPFLAAVSWWRLRGFRSLAQVHMRDFWLCHMPDETTKVFVFLATPYMGKLDSYLTNHVARHGQVITLISYGMPMPGKKPTRTDGSFLFYTYKP